MHPAIPISMVFLGCCSNVVFLELIVSEHPGAGNIITFMQFLFVAVEGFIFTVKFGTKKSAIPLKVYGFMVMFFFVVQVINNYAFIFKIPMTLHIIFRAGSLIASLVLGVFILKRKYPLSKYLSVILITIGICACTWASADSHVIDEKDEDNFVFNYILGVGVLVLSLFLTARMGIYQETIYREYGKHPKESLFFNHALPLPGFLLVASDIYSHISIFNQSDPVGLISLGLSVPKMWLFLAGNVITQYICIRSVFILTTECSALTVTLVVTLRKFASLILSIVYFKNPFTLLHWFGAACVFIGTFIFTEVLPLKTKAVEKKKQ
ncbi:UDP-xylose and UDP-N-acetylglucosamine transporter-like [Ruditapes philippinarum]|uniref:UDP-xylose and UDP-N-acetylglucosamine transporter-like n=1 Tax=Ruditapes philippinarum TaxID=129788 RepID=UPI00295BD414|nr:UDP-xylose and UDP-N-acetylglucosamine transporter-like [Ruditapes philippinarum]XP_060553084.1 UDP-xylose and UDP-N-acetylglucosamine transporter-like [Ruditapes philippinarum]XP_060553085.1 UDP-xylose and UDP-N-acetylglucosamine transporter-like [Ruditapes philippinarum]XP_060553086.1 UDP-xylose and UDP-N-acetylglucosamine transporter-like [Ruditapes philippinarum]